MLKCSVKIDQNLQRELNEKAWIYSLISLIVGAIGLMAYIIVGAFFEAFWLEVLLWFFAFAFGVGLTIFVSINKVNKNASAKNMTDNIELQENFLIEETVVNNEVVSTNKVYYKDILKIKETENYLFLYVNKTNAVPIPKKEFAGEDLSKIKVWVNSGKIKE